MIDLEQGQGGACSPLGSSGRLWWIVACLALLDRKYETLWPGHIIIDSLFFIIITSRGYHTLNV